MLHADIIPEHSHSVDKCVKIINTADYPGITFIAYVTHPAGGSRASIILPTTCLDNGYKFNSLRIFAAKTGYLMGKNINSIDWLHDKNCFRSQVYIDCFGGFADNTSPVTSIEESYKIEGFTDTSLILYKNREMTMFNNGQPPSVRIYKYSNGITSLDREKSANADYGENGPGQYLSHSVFDFFKALFYTIVIETMVLFLLFKTKYKTTGIKNNQLALAGLLCSFATLPYVWFILPVFIRPSAAYVMVSELSVTLIESFILCALLRINYAKAIVVSLICNMASFLTGLLLGQI